MSDKMHGKGLSAGRVGLISAAVIGMSCIAPAYTLSGGLGPTASVVGEYIPAIFLVSFIPMLLVAMGYKELNQSMPDSGTTFTWATRAFGPIVGWLGGWGLLAATILVLSNLAGIAVDFFYLLLSQITGNPEVAELTRNVPINIATCFVMISIATAISYRGLDTTKFVQYALVGFQIAVLVFFSVVAIWKTANGQAFDATPYSWEWLNPFGVESFSAFAAGVSLSVFIYWGWDVVLTMTEETKGSHATPGKAATLTIFMIVTLYQLIAFSMIGFAGTGDGEYGLGNPDIQENIFAALSGPVLGPLAIIMSIAVLGSSAASLQSTVIGPARTMLAMGYYGALPKRFASITPRFQSPGFATIVSAAVSFVFYAIMRVLSEAVLWDTITALGMMVCFYYGITAFACVWYFRHDAFDSISHAFNRFFAPLIGGTLLLVFFFQTSYDAMDPSYGSGSSLFGVGLVFILGTTVLVLGVVALAITWWRNPAFFRGETLTKGKPGDPLISVDSVFNLD
ncbi:amino acid/polyamine/organocation transporter, APC superfamily [Corynebacterium mustelae]|uniref:Amino acid/polyamine/organocation transporter, APC superfamily n=1 Tax=Corynebacterium mustelae TaxID=571915 RepID=A0A0G3H1U4_9CORY|nr:APC family permease [Corynebacterium mustelae]AKK06700.1 amino acid/polyamine/organocation transporter, APC superfamily [Corynebacterium mustelae]